MATRKSFVGKSTVGRCWAPVIARPWLATSLAALQLEKTLFSWRYPAGRSGKARRIRQVGLRITDLCNLRCGTCGQWGDHGYLHGRDIVALKKQEVPPERYTELFADLRRHGHRPIMYFWGGEPMLYTGILDVMDAAAALRMPVAIATNGTRIAAAADRLVRAPLFLLQVSVDGHDAELHNRLRPAGGGRDSFGEAVDALETVQKVRRDAGRSLPLIATLTTIGRDNAGHLAAIYDAFREKTDLMVFYLSWWIDEQRAREHDADFRGRFGFTPTRHRGWIGGWTPDDPEALHQQLALVRKKAARRGAPPAIVIPNLSSLADLRRYYADHSARFGYHRCIAIHQVIEVNSNGDVSLCRDYHDYVVGNVKEQTLVEVWNNPASRAFRRSLAVEGLMPVCTRCCGLMGY